MASFTQYPLTSGFMQEFWMDSGGTNKGHDYGLPIGTPVDAAVGGTVLSAGDSGDGWGISVKVRDAQGLIHNYGHLSAADVKPGDKIGPGMVLGKSGNTGVSSGPHLSYDVFDDQGQFYDPAPFVGGQEGQSSMYQDSDIGPLLKSLGYKYISGWGPSAIWQGKGEDGKDAKFIQAELANARLGEESPYYRAPAQKPSEKLDTRQVEAGIADAQGRLSLAVRSQDFDEARYQQSRLDDLQSQRDQLGLGYAQLGQTAANQQAQLGLGYAQLGGTLEIQRGSLTEQIRANIAAEARDNAMLQLQIDNARVEEAQGNKQLALQAQGIVEQTMSRIQNNRLERERMTQQMAVVDKQIAASAAESQADREFQGSEGAADRYLRASEGVAGRNLEREGLQVQDAQERARLGLQRDTAISEYAREPGDVGVISAMLQRGGFSNLSTALGQGETAITDRSLEPLASLLAPGPAAYDPRYETAPTAPRPGPITQALRAGQPAAQPAQVAPAAAAQASPYTPDQQADWMTLLTEGGVPAWARTAIGAPNVPVPGMEEGGAVVEPGVLNGLMKMAMMLGMEPKAIAGERGEANGETVMSNGDVVILPDKGKMAKGNGAEFSMSGGAHYGSAMRDKMPMMAEGGGMSMQGEHMMPDMPMMAEGGAILNPLIAQARAFMERTGQTTLQRSGFPAPPTPISLADPGTDPFVRRLGAATTATTRGIPQESFLNELMRLIPQGQQYGLGGRTR